MRSALLSGAALVLAATTLAACSQKDADAAGETTAMAAAPAPQITDANIAAIVVAANSADIGYAEVAMKKASNADVKGFAQTMITDHTAVNKMASDLVTKLGVTPVDNDVSTSLKDGGTKEAATLEGTSAAAFDTAYINNEVAYHQAVLDAIDQTLIPNAQNAELKALLVKVRPAIAAHLDHAKQIQGSLTK